MVVITFNPAKHHFDKETKTFSVSERDVQFATSYEVKNPTTGKSMEFNFEKSTGPEFDPNTKWIYKGKEGISLEVCNDPAITKQLAENYLKAKTSH